MRKILFLIVMISGWSFKGLAQNEGTENATVEGSSNFFNTNVSYQFRAYFSLGGSTPYGGIPREIREIEYFSPAFSVAMQGQMSKWIDADQRWAVKIGAGVDSKGMKTRTRVKNYRTEIEDDGQKISGYYTGRVYTNVKNTYATVPVSLVYRFARYWNVYGGLYFSGTIERSFNGYVSEGYLRQGTPVGAKLTFEDDARALYDFSHAIRKFQWGFQFGTEWSKKHLVLFPEFIYGFNGMMNRDFKALSFNLHNLYLNFGFGYKF